MNTRVTKISAAVWRAVLALALIAGILAVPEVASADDNPATRLTSLACDVVTSGSQTFAGHPVATPGETVTLVEEMTLDAGMVYQDILARPDGTTYVASAMTVRLPIGAGIEWQTNPFEFTIGGQTVPLTAGTAPDPSGFVLDVNSTDPNTGIATVYFPGDVADQLANPTWAGVPSYEVPANGIVFRLAFTGVVADPAAAGLVIEAGFCDAAVSTGPSNRADATETAKLAVGRPVIEAEKSASAPIVSAGDITTWTIDVRALADSPDGGAVTDAYDVVVVDTLPAGLVPVEGGVPLADGATTASGGRWDASGRTLTFNISHLAVGAEQQLTVDTQLEAGAPTSVTLTNIADLSATSRPGDVAGELTVNTSASAAVDTAPDVPAITKTASVPATFVGGQITYQVAVTLPAASGPYYDLSVMDELPDGIDFVETVSAECTGCSDAPSVNELASSTTDTGTRVGWYLGDLPRQDAPRTILVTYAATMADGYDDGRDIVLGDTFVNTATLGANTSDHDGGTAPSTDAPPTYDLTASDDATVAYGRPVLEIAKRLASSEAGAVADPARIVPDGNGVNYEVVVTNTGTVDALDVSVKDTPDARFTRFTAGSLPIDHAKTPSEPWLGWTIPGPIHPGESVVITYTATLPPALTTGMVMANTATVDSYADPGGANSFTGDSPAKLDLPVDMPRITLDKNLVTSVPAAGITTTGTSLTYSIRITNPSTSTISVFFCDSVPSGWSVPTAPAPIPNLTTSVSIGSTCAIRSNGNLPPGYDQTLTYTLVSNTSGTLMTPGDQTNTATVTGSVGSVSTVDGAPIAATDVVTVAASKPTLTVAKTPDPADAQGIISGGDSTFQILVSNTSNVPATNLTISDVLPAGLTYPGGVTSQVIGTGSTTLTDATTDQTRPTFRLSPLAGGDRIRIILPVHHTGATPPADRALVNTVNVTAPSLTTITDTGTLYVVANAKAPSVTKSVDVAQAVPGSTVNYTVGVTIPSNQVPVYDLTAIDSLPDGLSYVGPSTVTCVTGCGEPGVPVSAPFIGTDGAAGATALADGSQQVAWFFGDVPADTPESTWTITFPVRMDSTFDGTGTPEAGSYVAAGVPGSDPLTNRVQALFRTSDATTNPTTIPAGPWDGRSPTASADVSPLTPSVTLTKTVDSARVEVGALLTYKVTAKNVGNSTAYGVVVHDDLAGGVLREVTFDSGNPSSPTLDPSGATFELASLAPGASATWTYTARTPLSADLNSATSGSVVDPVKLINTASVVEFNSTSGGPGNIVYSPTTTTSKTTVLVDTPIAQISATITNLSAVCKTVEAGEVWKYQTTAGNRWSKETGLSGGSATGYDPVLRITTPAGAELVPGSLVLTIGGTRSALAPTVSVNGSGATVYEWDNLPDVPQGRTDYFVVTMSLTAVTASAQMGATMHEIWMNDAAGEPSRSANTPLGEYDYYARWTPGCSPVPRLVKEPTAVRGVVDRGTAANVKAGDPYTWHVSIMTSDDDLNGVRLTDVLPAGVTYVGPAVLTAASGGPAAAMSETVTPLGDGRTKIEWVPAAALTARTIYDLAIPTTIDADALVDQTLLNSIELTAATPLATNGCRPDTLCDTGAVYVVNPVKPTITKSVDSTRPYRYGEDITYTLDVTIPAGRAFDEMTVTDIPNYQFTRNGSTAASLNMSTFEYVSGYCLSGCTNSGPGATPAAADDILVTTLTKTQPTSGVVSANGATSVGWYLQAPGASPTRRVANSTTTRVVRLTFTTRTAQLTQQQISNGLINNSSSIFQDVSYTDQAKLYYTDNASYDFPYSTSSWASALNALTNVADAKATVQLSHPQVEISKLCYDPANRANYVFTRNGESSGSFRPREVAPGVTNVVCELKTTNTSSMSVYNAAMTDRPRKPDASVGALWVVQDLVAPSSVAVDQEPVAANDYVGRWTISALAPGESATVVEHIHLDYWTNPTNWGNSAITTTRNELSNTANFADPSSTIWAPTALPVSVSALITRPVITSSKAPVDSSSYHLNTSNAVPGQPFSWEINLDYWGEQSLDTLSVADTLPVGWTYVPGSARLLASASASRSMTTVPGYQVIPLPDATMPNNPVAVPSDTTCDPATLHEGGQEVKWVFDRSDPDFDQPWNTNPANPEVFAPYGYTTLDPQITLGFDALFDGPYSTSKINTPPYDVVGFGDLFTLAPYSITTSTPSGPVVTPGVSDILLANGGAYDVVEWKRLTLVFDAIPTQGAVDCIQEAGVPEVYENNVTVQGTRGSNSAQLTSSATATAPLLQPVGVRKTPDAGVVADGGTATFEIEVTNYSDTTVNDLTVTDVLSGIGAWGGVYQPGSATASGGINLNETSVVINGDDTTVTWLIDSLDPGKSTTISMPIPVPLDTADGTPIPNKVTVSSPDMPTSQSDDGHITVRNPQPAPPVTKTMPATARPGDRFNVPVVMTAPAGAAYLDLAVLDTVPDGLNFVGYGSIDCVLASGGACPGWTIGTISTVGNGDGTTSIGWFLGDLPSADGDRTFTFNYMVEVAREYSDASPVSDGDVLVNEVTAYSNDANVLPAALSSFPDPSAFDYASEPGTASTLVGIPSVVIDKVASTTGPLRGGEEVTYTLTVQNLGHGDAYSVQLTDTPLGGVVNVAPGLHADWLTKGWTAADPELRWSIPRLAAGQQAEITYVVTVGSDVPSLIDGGTTSLDNSAAIDEYRDGPRRSTNSNTIDGGDPVEISIPYEGSGLAVSKFIGGCSGESATVLPGSTVDWCIVVTNASAVPAPGVSLIDRLPSEFAYVAGSATVTPSNPDPSNPDPSNPVPANVEPSTQSRSGYTELGWTLDEIEPGGAVTVEFSTTVAETASGSVENGAIAQLLTTDGTPSTSRATTTTVRDSAAASFAVAGSEISKVPDEQLFKYAGIGGPITWDIVVTNPQTAPLNNLVITDSLPAGLSYVGSTSTYPGWVANSETVGPVGSGPSGTTPIVWSVPSLQPAETFTITVLATAPETVVSGDEFVNHVAMTADEIPVPVENQARVRIYGDLVPPTVAKDVDRPIGVVGERRVFTVNATFEPNQTLFDAAVVDRLPDGLRLDSVISAACSYGCGDGTPEPTRVDPVANLDGSTTHGWWIGTVVSGAEPVVYTFTYSAYVGEFLSDGSTPNVAGDSFTNQVSIWSNPLPVIDADAGTPGATPTPPDSFECAGCSWEFQAPPAEATVELVGPVLTLDHDLSCDPDAQPGDGVDHCVVGVGSTHTYTVRITNTGTSTAYDVDITDLLPEGLVGVVPSSTNPGTLTHPWSVDDPTLGWRIDSIPVDGEIVLTFTVVIDPSVDPGTVLSAPASVDEYWGAPEADRSPEHIPGVNPPSDTVSVEVVAPVLVLDEDVSCDPNAEPGDGVDTCVVEPGQEVIHTLRITNTGTGTAYDTLVTSLPGMELIGVVLDSPPAGITVEDGWLSGDPLIGWRIDEIQPNQVITLVYRATVDPAVSLDATIDTPARIPEYWGAPADVRAPDTPSFPEPVADATQLTLVAPDLGLDHDITCDADAEPGDGVDHCEVVPGATANGVVRIDNHGTGPAYDTTVRVDIPAGLTSIVIDDLGGGVVVTEYSIEDGYFVVRFDGPLAPGEERTIRWHGVVDPSVEAGTTLSSPAEIIEAYILPEDRRSPENEPVVLPPADAISVVTVIPNLVIDKSVTCDSTLVDGGCTVAVGTTVHYRVVVTNEGPTSVFDPVIGDLADPAVIPDTSSLAVSVDGAPRAFVLVDDYSTDDRDVAIRVEGEIDAGSDITITYDSAVTEAGRPLDNTAEVASAFLVPADERDPGSEPVDAAELSTTGQRPTDDATVDAVAEPTTTTTSTTTTSTTVPVTTEPTTSTSTTLPVTTVPVTTEPTTSTSTTVPVTTVPATTGSTTTAAAASTSTSTSTRGTPSTTSPSEVAAAGANAPTPNAATGTTATSASTSTIPRQLAATGSDTSGSLAMTGASVAGMVVVALGSMAVGTLLIAPGRRRRRRD